MSHPKLAGQSSIFKALKKLKEGDIDEARRLMGIQPRQVNDEDFAAGMISFEKGLTFLLSAHHPKAVQPLREALTIIKLSTDDDAKFFVSVLADFADGISKLLGGDAHSAVGLLDVSAEAIERLSFFLPGFEKLALSFKAASRVALARTFMNSGNLSEAESCFGSVTSIYDDLLGRLNETNKEDIPLIAEVFGSRIEGSILFMSLDISVLDFDSMNLRLESTKDSYDRLKEILPKVAESPIKSAFEILCILYTVFETITPIGRRIIIERMPLTKVEFEELSAIDSKLFQARQIANTAGERGRVFLFSINQLSRLHERFLPIGKVRKKDFGRLSGLISLMALIVQVLLVHFTIRPTGNTALVFFLGEIIIALIVGYGYEAIKFKPLVGLYSEALKSRIDKTNENGDAGN